MADFFIAVGGTGQIVAVSYTRLMRLMPWSKSAQMYHMDRDTVRNFTTLVTSSFIDPLPAAAGATVGSHFADPAHHQLCHDILDTLFTTKEQQTRVGSGMYGHPPVGASMIVDKLTSEADGGLVEVLEGDPRSSNAYLKDGSHHTIVICGSAMGGTGAGGVPSLAQYLDQALGGHRANVKLYVLYFLKHFNLRPRRADLSSSAQEAIVNAQIATNARSGMCYLTDKIAKGTDGCLLFGLDVATSRDYEDVGAQTEQSQSLHLLAALYAQRLFAGEQLPGRHNAHAIDLETAEGRTLARNLGTGVKVPGGRTVSLERVLQLNTAASRFLSRLARIIQGAVGFAFVPTMPRELSRGVEHLVKLTKDDRMTVRRTLRAKLLIEAERIDEAVNRIVALCQESVPFALALRPELDGKEYRKALSRPLVFAREWTSRLDNTAKVELDYDTFTEALVFSLYRTLDVRFFNGDFGLVRTE